jgi:hypothetical protein
MNTSKILKLVPAVLVCCAVSTAAFAKLPAPPAADPAKAEEANKKKAEAAKKEADLLSKSQDRAVEHYKRTKGGGGMATKPMAAPAAMPMAAPAKPMAAKK